MNPWERQAKESAPAFEAFAMYRDTPPGSRSYAGVAQALGKSKTLIDRWGRAWRWVDRVAAWDALIDRQVQERNASARLKMNERQAALGAGLQNLAALVTRDMVTALQLQAAALEGRVLTQAEEEVANRAPKLTAAEAALVARRGAAIERAARGEPTEFVSLTGAPAAAAHEGGDLAGIYDDPEIAEAADRFAELVARKSRGDG